MGYGFLQILYSNKGHHIANNPYVAAIFFWTELKRQVRVNVKVSKLSSVVSDEYFSERPEKSRISAIVSPQSRVIPNRDNLESRFSQDTSDSSNDHTTRPDYWGGYLLTPAQIEFWQGRPDRLHDRLFYSRQVSGWILQILAP